MGRIILVRHGQTFSNEARILDTRPPGAELTDLGKQQAAEAGARLAEVSPNLAGASCAVSIRTQQTAQRLLASYERERGLDAGSIPLDVKFGLHEIFVGDFEGQRHQEAHDAYNTALVAWMHEGLDDRMPGGESPREVIARYQPILERIAEDIAGTEKDHMVVCHGGVMRIVGRYNSDVPETIAFETYMANCQFVILDPSAGDFGQWHCESWAGVEL